MKFSLGTETKRRPRALLNRHPYRDGSLVSRTEDRFNRSGYLARCQHPLSQTRHPARRIAATSRAPSFINAAVSKYGTDYSKRMPRVGGRDRTKERAIDFLRSTNWKLDSWGGGEEGGRKQNRPDACVPALRADFIRVPRSHRIYVDCQSYDIGSYEIVTSFLTAERDSPRVYFSCHALRLNGC